MKNLIDLVDVTMLRIKLTADARKLGELMDKADEIRVRAGVAPRKTRVVLRRIDDVELG